MAGTVTHLAIADRICEKLGERIKNLPLFYSGNIAPDAIHARANYERAFKKHTHMTEGMHGGDFLDAGKLMLFYSRVNQYIDTYYHRENADSDLYLGYIVHLITDELFNSRVRKQFLEKLKAENINESDPEFFKKLMHDIRAVDKITALKYPFKNNAKDLLNAVWDYEIADMITAHEINASKAWVISTCFDGKPGDEPVYYSYDENNDFISESADNIIYRLSNGVDYLKIL